MPKNTSVSACASQSRCLSGSTQPSPSNPWHLALNAWRIHMGCMVLWSLEVWNMITGLCVHVRILKSQRRLVRAS